MLEDYLYKSSGLLYTLSPQMAASCTPNPGSCGGSGGCMGGTAEIVFDHMAAGEETMAQEWQYGYRSYYGEDYECDVAEVAPLLTVQGFTMLAGNNYTELMNAVAQVGPVSIGVDASEWHNYEGGVFNGCDQKNPDVNHAVVLYGYGVDAETGEKFWNIRNSWSPSYGEKVCHHTISIATTLDIDIAIATITTTITHANTNHYSHHAPCPPPHLLGLYPHPPRRRRGRELWHPAEPPGQRRVRG